MKKSSELSAISTDSHGRVVLGDDALLEIEKSFTIATGGGSSNNSCTNDTDCAGSTNTSCSNHHNCKRTDNSGCLPRDDSQLPQ
jgi:hypothetical protein